MYYTRIMGAEHQINEAIWLFFQGRSPIGCYVLISSAHQVIKNMLAKKNIVSIVESFNANPEELKLIMNSAKSAYNKLKHADYDPQIDIDEFDFGDVEPFIYIACKDFFKLAGGYTQAMQIFEVWFVACYPKKIAPGKEAYLESAQNVFTNIHEVPLTKRQHMGLEQLVKYHNKPELDMPIVREWSSV